MSHAIHAINALLVVCVVTYLTWRIVTEFEEAMVTQTVVARNGGPTFQRILNPRLDSRMGSVVSSQEGHGNKEQPMPSSDERRQTMGRQFLTADQYPLYGLRNRTLRKPGESDFRQGAPSSAASFALPAPAPMSLAQGDGLVLTSRRRWAKREDSPPSVYACFDPGESYSASYLTRKIPLLMHRYGIAPAQHMETGGTVFRRQFVPYKTVNMFDFGVEHLSWLERRLGSTNLPPAEKKLFIDELMGHLRSRQDRLMREATLAPSVRHRVSSKIIVLMPFFSGGSGDAGHSVPELRRLYLNVSFWSFYRHVKDLAVCVCTDADKAWLRHQSGLPWFEVIKEDCRVNVTREKGKLLENPYVKWKPSLLGVLTSRRAQHYCRARIWPHEWVLYTESDQVLFVRNMHQLLNLTNDRTRYVAPHRLLPLPILEDFPRLASMLKNGRVNGHALAEMKRNSARPIARFVDETEGSCCFDPGTCTSRNHWKPWLRQNTAEWPMVKLGDSFPMLPGEGNFLRMSFRMCDVRQGSRMCDEPRNEVPRI